MTRSITVTGADKTANRLRAMASRVRNVEEALAKVPDTLEDHIARTFDTEGASVGKRWRILTKPYEARKREQSASGPLVLSGGLRESFKGGVWHVERLGPDRLRWGTRHPLARIHQKGTPGKQVPARRMLVVTPALKRQIKGDLKSHILRGQTTGP